MKISPMCLGEMINKRINPICWFTRQGTKANIVIVAALANKTSPTIMRLHLEIFSKARTFSTPNKIFFYDECCLSALGRDEVESVPTN